ncbi:glycosyltransferase family 4 protein [Cupriavidus nantongensis]|uniref:glycosyltransferase family 4 protein n=1 Tax=Cupriavidus nantongensis TaxID=1796606 RepID=UPI0022458655|nr:glycosyltransferase family 4 protein [Cupriavidus nantongensis]
MSMKALLMTRYGRMGASSRLRFMQFIPWLENAGVSCNTQPFFNDSMLAARYQAGQYKRTSLLESYRHRVGQMMRRRDYDLVWIEKEALPWFPAAVERAFLRHVPYALDFDDALFHNYDLHGSVLVRKMLGRRIDRLMAGATLVTAGNAYLAQRATDAGAKWVEIIPTVIDLDRYIPRQARPVLQTGVEREVLRIVWIGSPSTATYLALLAEPLKALATRFQFELRVIGANFTLDGVNVECVPWQESTEVDRIAECDIGIMPLNDSPWERGKCGYKLIQYMACGLPVVASPVGANNQIVKDQESGFLAATPRDWEIRLGQLLADASLRRAMGHSGRDQVESKYCVQQLAPRLATLLKRAGAQ